MPVVVVQLWEGRTLEQKRALVAAITRSMVDIVDADPSVLQVVLQEVAPENWGRNGILGSDRHTHGGDQKPRIIGLSHVLLQVRDLGEAESFYVGSLGFGIRRRDSLPDGRPLIVLDEGMGLTPGGPKPPGPVEHIAFRTRNVALYVDLVQAGGGEILVGPQPGAYGTSLYFSDPSGNKIEFHGD